LFLALFLVTQVFIPLRGFVYPGNPNWSQYSHNFSWKFRVNDLRGGLDTKLIVEHPINEQRTVIPLDQYLASLQATAVGCNAMLIHQFACKVADKYK
jgi:vitamin K-dependent gamma-carboxylase